MKYFVLLATIFITACGSSSDEESISNKLIAKFDEHKLFHNDVKDLIPKEASTKDSAEIVSKYIDIWLKKQLLTKEATSSVSETNLIEIDKKTNDYKNSLIIHEFQKQLIKDKLDTVVAVEEIKDFYNKHEKDFELKQNIVKCFLIKISIKSQSLKRFKYDFYQNVAKDYLGAYYKEFPERFLSIDSTWKPFENIIKGTPYAQIANKTDWLTKNKRYLMIDGKHNYFLIIEDYKLQNKVSPLDFIKDQIKSIILNRRKLDLINNYEQGLYKKAFSEKRIERY